MLRCNLLLASYFPKPSFSSLQQQLLYHRAVQVCVSACLLCEMVLPACLHQILSLTIQGGSQLGSLALYGLGSVLQERGGGGSGWCPCHFYKAPHQPLHRIPNQSVLLLTQQNGPSLASPPPPVSPVPSSALHIPPSPPLQINLMYFHQRCALLLFPSSHPLTPFCISTHTPSGFDAGYRLLLHYGWLLFSRRPFRHPTLLSLLLSPTHFSSRAPPLSVFHLGYPLVHVVMVQ